MLLPQLLFGIGPIVKRSSPPARSSASRILYADVPNDEDLGGGLHGALELGRPPADLMTELPAYMHVQPVKGRLVLFPSTPWHATIPFDQQPYVQTHVERRASS